MPHWIHEIFAGFKQLARSPDHPQPPGSPGPTLTRQTGRLQLDDQEIEFLLIRMPRRKQLTLRVTPTGAVEVRAPWRVGLARAKTFIHEHKAWLLAKRVQLLNTAQQPPPLSDGFLLPWLDSVLVLRIGGNETTRIRRIGNELHMPPPLLPGSMEAMLERWYRNQARIHLTARLQWHAQQMGLAFAKLTIRGQKKRWGSCSTQGNISLNWQLMFLPAKVVDYVIVHELCHRLHMNHSPAFWSQVAAVLPEYRQLKAQLKTIQTPWRSF